MARSISPRRWSQAATQRCCETERRRTKHLKSAANRCSMFPRVLRSLICESQCDHERSSERARGGRCTGRAPFRLPPLTAHRRPPGLQSLGWRRGTDAALAAPEQMAVRVR